MRKNLLLLPLAAAITLTLSSCSLWSGAISLQSESTVSKTSVTETTVVITTAQPTTQAVTTTKSGGSSDTKTTTKKPQTTAAQKPAEGTTSKYYQEGTVHFSDASDNLFIKAVADKYGADPALLAAVYYVPQSDTNTVLQFNGTKNSDGKPIRNGTTLKYIYILDASYNVTKRASENPLENEGCKASESVAMFFTVRKWLIPKFETELS